MAAQSTCKIARRIVVIEIMFEFLAREYMEWKET
jgi:hypothetical protein